MATAALMDKAAPATDTKSAKKRLVRRARRDYSQRLRRITQVCFVGLNLWLGFEFYRFVRYFETGGHGAGAARPAGVEGWLPIAGLMNLKQFLLEGTVPKIHPAAMFLLIAFLGISLLLRKSFCSWLCPIGTVSEALWRLGRRIFKQNVSLPRGGDIALRSLKYLLLSFFLYAVIAMPVQAIAGFMQTPYGLLVDVKMLNFFRFLGTAGAITIGVLVLLSLIVQNFWCRYLCPYGALMGLVSLFSPARIWREPETCIDCSKCARACPSALAVDKLVTIRSAECTGCMECVAVCPAEGALQMSLPKKRIIPAWAFAAAILTIFLGTVAVAKLTEHWDTNVPREIYSELIGHVSDLTHPGI